MQHVPAWLNTGFWDRPLVLPLPMTLDITMTRVPVRQTDTVWAAAAAAAPGGGRLVAAGRLQHSVQGTKAACTTTHPTYTLVKCLVKQKGMAHAVGSGHSPLQIAWWT
jgi:hypothetical protein